MILLYRLLFVLYAEDRNLLPDERGPYAEFALTRMRGEIADRKLAGAPFAARSLTYWSRLETIFGAIADGDDVLGIPPYNGGLFDPAAVPLLSRVRLLAISAELEVPSLLSAAAPLLVRVLDENVRDRDAALATADELIGSLGRAPRVLTAKAKVLWRGRDLPEALALYEEALPTFPLGLSWRSDVLREASVAAGRAADWPLAAQRMAEAFANLSEGEPLVRHVGFLFDLAIALHLSGRRREAVDRLGQAIELMAEDGQQMPPEPLLSVRQMGSQAIKSIGAESGRGGTWGRANLPLPSIFGSTSAMEELTWDGQRPASLDPVVLLMAELDILMPEPPTSPRAWRPGSGRPQT